MAASSKSYSSKMEIYNSKKNLENTNNVIIYDHHVINDSRVLTLDKLTLTEIIPILISKVHKNSSNMYFENLLDDNDIRWATTYMLPSLVSYNTYMRSFQYKLWNNVLLLNKKRHIFGTKHFHYVPFVTYEKKHLYMFFMNVIILNVYGWIWFDIIKIV